MIVVQADPRDLERVLVKLQRLGGNAPGALRNAVNATAAGARRLLAQGVRARYTVKAGGLSRHMELRRATLARLSAAVTVRGGALTLPRFHMTAPRRGVRAEVLRGSGLKELVNRAGNRAFRVELSGHPMAFQRTGRARYPLRALHGPSAAKMAERVYSGGPAEAGLKEALARLYRDNLQKQADRVVKG